MGIKEAYYTLDSITDESNDNLIKYKLSQVKNLQIWFKKNNNGDVTGINISWSDPEDLKLNNDLILSKWKYTKVFVSTSELPEEALLFTDYSNEDEYYLYSPSSIRYKFKYYMNDIRDGCNKHVNSPILYADTNNPILSQVYYIYIIPVSSTGTHTLDNCMSMIDLSNNTVSGREKFSFKIRFDKSDSNEIIEYTGKNQNYTPASFVYNEQTRWYDFNPGSWGNAFFLPRPCMLKFDGTVDYYLDPVNYLLKEDGTPSDIKNIDYEGNAMMEWGSNGFIYYYSLPPKEAKLTEYEFIIEKVPFGETPSNENMVCYPFINSNHTISKHFYTPIFLGIEHDGKLRSMGIRDIIYPNGHFKFADVVKLAENNNLKPDENIWTIEMHQTHVFINMLFLLMFKSPANEVLNYKRFKPDGLATQTVHSIDNALNKLYNSKNKLFDIITDRGSITDYRIRGYQIFGMFDYIPYSGGAGRAKLGLLIKQYRVRRSSDSYITTVCTLHRNSWNLLENASGPSTANQEEILTQEDYKLIGPENINKFNISGEGYKKIYIEYSPIIHTAVNNNNENLIVKMGMKQSEFNIPFLTSDYQALPPNGENLFLNANLEMYLPPNEHLTDGLDTIRYFATIKGSLFGLCFYNYNTPIRVLAGLQCIPIS